MNMTYAPVNQYDASVNSWLYRAPTENAVW